MGGGEKMVNNNHGVAGIEWWVMGVSGALKQATRRRDDLTVWLCRKAFSNFSWILIGFCGYYWPICKFCFLFWSLRFLGCLREGIALWQSWQWKFPSAFCSLILRSISFWLGLGWFRRNFFTSLFFFLFIFFSPMWWVALLCCDCFVLCAFWHL